MSVRVDVAEVRVDSEDPQNVAGEIQARGENITNRPFFYAGGKYFLICLNIITYYASLV